MSAGPSTGPREVLARALHPPWRDGHFWAAQAAVVGLAGLHFYLDSSEKLESTALPTGTPVTLLLIPVLYAALRDGLAGSAATALLATVLWLPDVALPDARGHPGGDVIDLLIVDAVAVFVGVHIERRREADARYRELFLTVRSYAALLVDAQEEERLRIARDIHDDPLQRLVDVARRMDSAEPRPSKEDLLDVIARLRDIARGLRPPGLDQLGLVAAVRGMLADLEDASPVSTRLDVEGTAARLAPPVELTAFRIVQEAARNATLHAHPSTLAVSLRYAGRELRIRVSDDGSGFDVAAGGDGRGGAHLGLVGMRERAALLGGSLSVTSRPGNGTTVSATLPAQPASTASP